jgi:hypothetical protein
MLREAARVVYLELKLCVLGFMLNPPIRRILCIWEIRYKNKITCCFIIFVIIYL